MTAKTSPKPTMLSEFVTLLSIAGGVAAVAGVLYWWGSRDAAFERRKSALLQDQLSKLVADRNSQSGMQLFVSYTQEAETTRRLLDCSLDKATWLRIAQQHTNAICKLVSMGNVACAAELTGWCDTIQADADPQKRALVQSAECALEFERQYLFCKQKMLVLDLLELADHETCGDIGKKIAALIRQHQKSDWRITVLVPKLQQLGNQLPQGSKLAPRLSWLISKIVEVESAVPVDLPYSPFDAWIRQAQLLVANDPQNVDICRGIIQHHDRLAELRCFDEAQQLLDVALNTYRSETKPDLKPHVDQLIDRAAVAQIGLDRWNDLVQKDPTQSAQIIEPFKTGAQQLSDQRLVSPGVMSRFVELSSALEHKQQYESLSKFRSAMLENVTTDSATQKRLKTYCAASSKRVALVGHPFVLPHGMAVAQPLDPGLLKDRVTAVLFWSSHDSNLLSQLRHLDKLYTTHHQSGFGFLAINTDTDLEQAQFIVSQATPTWPIAVAAGLDATGSNPLAVEYGIEQTPYLILVDQQGIVVDVALSTRDMWSRATELQPRLKSQSVAGRPSLEL